MFWDVLSGSSQDEIQVDDTEGRVYNDTFDDSSYNGSEEISDLDTKYSTSFETTASDRRDERRSKDVLIVIKGSVSESFESDGSESSYTYTTGCKSGTDIEYIVIKGSVSKFFEGDGSESSYTYTTGGKSGTEIEYQSSYTTSYSYDTASTGTTVLGRKGFPLM